MTPLSIDIIWLLVVLTSGWFVFARKLEGKLFHDLRKASEKVFKMHQETSERLEKTQNSYKMVTITPLEVREEKWVTTINH